MPIAMRIEHRAGGRWYVVSESGKPLGDYATEAEAKERLRQVEAHKHAAMVKDDRGREIHEGDRVRFRRPEGGGASGTVVAITADGLVVIDTDDGATYSIRATDVVVGAKHDAMATAEGALHHDGLLGERTEQSRDRVHDGRGFPLRTGPRMMRVVTVPAWRFSVSTGRWDQFAKLGEFEKDGAKVVFDERTLGEIVENFAARRNDVGMDYEHQALNAPLNGQPAPALAWYSSLALVIGGKVEKFATHDPAVQAPDGAGFDDGLYGYRAEVTPLGEKLLPNYKFISPAFTTEGVDEQGRSIGYDLLNVAATCTPFLDGMAPIEMRRLGEGEKPITRMAAISLPPRFQWMNGGESMQFPVEPGRYEVTVIDRQQGNDTLGVVDSIEAAVRAAVDALRSADAVYVGDRKRGFAVAKGMSRATRMRASRVAMAAPSFCPKCGARLAAESNGRRYCINCGWRDGFAAMADGDPWGVRVYIPGKGMKEKFFKTREAAEKWVDQLLEKEGSDIQVSWSPPPGSGFRAMAVARGSLKNGDAIEYKDRSGTVRRGRIISPPDAGADVGAIWVVRDDDPDRDDLIGWDDVVRKLDRRGPGLQALARTNGYVYRLEGGANWQAAPDDDWETVVAEVDGRVMGRRQIDGSTVVVIESGGRLYAALPQNVSMGAAERARTAMARPGDLVRGDIVRINAGYHAGKEGTVREIMDDGTVMVTVDGVGPRPYRHAELIKLTKSEALAMARDARGQELRPGDVVTTPDGEQRVVEIEDDHLRTTGGGGRHFWRAENVTKKFSVTRKFTKEKSPMDPRMLMARFAFADGAPVEEKLAKFARHVALGDATPEEMKAMAEHLDEKHADDEDAKKMAGRLKRFAEGGAVDPTALMAKLGLAEGAPVEEKLAKFAHHFASGDATPEEMKAMAEHLEAEHADHDDAQKMAKHFKRFAEAAPFAGEETPEEEAKEHAALAGMARTLGLPRGARPSEIAVALSAKTAPLTTVADLQGKVARLEEQLAAREGAETATRAQAFARQAVTDGRTTADKAKLVEETFIRSGDKAAEALLFQKGTFTVLRRYTAGGEIPGKESPLTSDAQPEPDDIRGRMAAKANEIMEAARKAGTPIGYGVAMTRIRSVDPTLYAAFAALGTPSR